MRLVLHKNFKKSYKKLSAKLRAKVDDALCAFYCDPFDPLLKNHALGGSMVGKRAVSVTGDVRIIFEEYDGYILVIVLDVGTHNQVY
ncbi:hypothetical protein CO046_00175 [Candidatus Peregrinibacteria bacterium CG_4_9_14_0_2_um_filter_53_11]|nr:MAG: hypothetical protein CO046_00175 [Candidatus Peregrinibacteria bacterium CG_4_9_14_0_2_um_filter_53_11]